jgi:hypothetical protein
MRYFLSAALFNITPTAFEIALVCGVFVSARTPAPCGKQLLDQRAVGPKEPLDQKSRWTGAGVG